MTDRGDLAEILDEYLRALEAGNPPDRDALLAQHPDLAEELQAAMLGVDFVYSAAPRLAPEEHADALPGRSLGDYRVLRELGRGGMAVVYEAEQISLGRRVALKVLPFAAVLDPKQLQRFKNEALAAAHLHHPNIVPVYGVGCERGVHYYAMQFVEGQSLATAIREMKGSETSEEPKTPISSHGSNREPAYIRMAAALGVQAAEALDHAHQLGIVHRDVKPGNLLVDQAGALWVTDFGVASSVANVGLTMTGELLGTIRYMSPEQAQAKRAPIDHRTDVYSLGATLYEFFTLEPAFPGDDPHVLIQDIATKEPVLPRRLNPAIPSDLETVLLKAMSKEPAHRYATALEMAEDLTHFLENRPIEAKRPGPLRRAAKWGRRHRTLVGATVVLLLLSTAGLATGTALLWREQAQTKAAYGTAQANLDLALQALDQIYIDEAEGHPKIREGLPKDLLQRGLGFYEKFVTENARNQGAVFLMGNAYLSAGLIYRELNEEARAVESLGRALAAYDRAIEIDPRDAGAHTNRGWALGALGRFEEAVAVLDRALEISPLDPRIHNNRGYVLRDLGRLEESLAAFDRALQIDPRSGIAENNRGVTLSRLRRREEALAAYDRALVIDPNDALVHSNRSKALADLRRFEEALAACGRALEIDPRSVSAHSSRSHALENLGRFEEALAECDRALEIDSRSAAAHANRGNALHRLGRLEEALAACNKAVDLDARSSAAHNNRGLVLHGLGRLEAALADFDLAIDLDPRNASAYLNRGTVLRDLGRVAEALADYDRALVIEPLDPGVHSTRGALLCDYLDRPGDALVEFDRAIALDPRFADAHRNRCLALRRLGRDQDALEEFDRVIELLPRNTWAHRGRGKLLCDLGRFEDALTAYDKLLEIAPGSAEGHILRGVVFCDHLGRPREGLAEFDRAIELDSRSAVAHTNRGIALWELGHSEEALTACDRAIDIDTRYAIAHATRGHALQDLGRLEEALAEFDEAIEIDSRYTDALNGRGCVLRDTGHLEDALAAFDRAIDIDPRCANAYYNRGNALAAKGEDEAAIGAYRETIQLRPDFPEAHCNLGHALTRLGRFQEALASLRRGHELGSRRAFWDYPSGEWVQDAEPKAAVEGRLDQVLSGKTQPRDAAERIDLALMLYRRARHAESARMFAEAFAADATLAEDLVHSCRYNAACSAALAAAAGGADATAWRGQALEWLRADLAAREKAATGLAAMLELQKTDPDFASVRDRLGDLPESERAAWRGLWADVDRALASAPSAAE